MKAGSSTVTIVLGAWALLSTVSGCDQEAECPRGTKATGSRCTQQLPDSIDVVPSVFQSGGDASGKDTTDGDAVQEDSTSDGDVFGETVGHNSWRYGLFQASSQLLSSNINTLIAVDRDSAGTLHDVRLQNGGRWQEGDQLQFGGREDRLGRTAPWTWVSDGGRNVSLRGCEKIATCPNSGRFWPHWPRKRFRNIPDITQLFQSQCGTKSADLGHVHIFSQPLRKPDRILPPVYSVCSQVVKKHGDDLESWRFVPDWSEKNQAISGMLRGLFCAEDGQDPPFKGVQRFSHNLSEPVDDIVYSPYQVGYGIVKLPLRTLFQCKQPFEFRVTTGTQPCLTIMAGADIPPYPGGFLRNNQTEGSPLMWSEALSLSWKSILEDGQLPCELPWGRLSHAHDRACGLYYLSQRGVCGAKNDFLWQVAVWYADQVVWRDPRPSCGRFTSIASVEHKSWSGVENQNNRDEVSVDLGVQARLGWCGSVAETIDAQKDAHQCRRGRESRRDSAAGRTSRKPRDRNAQQRASKRQHL